MGRSISNIQKGGEGVNILVKHLLIMEILAQADELWCRLSLLAATESLTPTFAQARTDTEANQQL